VIAYGAGGALASVVEGVTGFFFAEQTPEALSAVVRSFRDEAFDPRVIRRHAEQYDTERFLRRFEQYVAARLAERPALAWRGEAIIGKASDQPEAAILTTSEMPDTPPSVAADQGASQ
jgi:hypothetical protein